MREARFAAALATAAVNSIKGDEIWARHHSMSDIRTEHTLNTYGENKTDGETPTYGDTASTSHCRLSMSVMYKDLQPQASLKATLWSRSQ